MWQKRLVWWLAVLIVGLLWNTQPVFAQNATARVRVIHAAPDTPAVDVLLDGNTIVTNVGFPAISDYLDVPAGSHTLALTPTGQGASAAILQADITTEAGQYYTAAAIGLKDVSVKLYNDNLGPIPQGKARVRFIHTSPDAPGADIEVINGPTLFQNVGFGEASEYLEVDAGTYDLRAVVAGANTVIVQLPQTKIDADTLYDVFAVGRLANIQVTVGTAKPVANQAVLGSEGEADAVPEGVQNTMPNTGDEDIALWVVFLALLLIANGLMFHSHNLISRRR